MRNTVVLEDKPVHAALIRRALEKIGMHVQVIRSADDAIRQWDREALFIIDLQLEGQPDGLKIIDQIQRHTPNAFIVAYSQHLDEEPWRLAAQQQRPNMTLLKGNRDIDALTILAGYYLDRIDRLQREQTALLFLIARFGAFVVIWIGGLLALTFANNSLPWIGALAWAAIWTIGTAVTWAFWTTRSGQRVDEIKDSRLFGTFLRANRWLTGLFVALILAIVADVLIKTTFHHP